MYVYFCVYMYMYIVYLRIKRYFSYFDSMKHESPSPMIAEEDEPMFYSPIQVISTRDIQEKESGSPSEVTIKFSQSGSFRKILEKDNEDESESENDTRQHLYDLEGNQICEFNAHDDPMDEEVGDLPVIQDKENDLPCLKMQTPLKNKELRSPLKDITPSMTKRKKKSSAIRTFQKNNNYLTPRTMAQSRFSSSSGLRRIERL